MDRPAAQDCPEIMLSGKPLQGRALPACLLAVAIAGDGAAGDQFGFSVDVDGTMAIVGSLNDDDEGFNSGTAYLFDVSTGQLLHKLTAGDGAAGDQSGYSVAISGETAIVGSRYDDLSRGAAYLFDVTSGQQIAKLVADDGESGDAFGWSVDIDSDTAVVGSYIDDTERGANAGSAHLFDVSSRNQIARLTGGDGLQGDQFGYSVAVSDDLLVVGSLLGDGSQVDSGAAYAFTPVPLPAGAWLLLSGLGVLALARHRGKQAG
jgi:WD40 repeat protein